LVYLKVTTQGTVILKNLSNRPALKWPKRKDREVKGDFGGPWRVIGTTLLIFLVTQLVAAIVVESVMAAIHPGTKIDGTLVGSAPAQFFYILLAEGGAVWLVLTIIKRSGLKLAHIGLGRKPVALDIVKGLLGFGVFFAILVVVNGVLSALFPELNAEQQDVGFNTLNNSIDWVLALLALVILPPIGEEVLVRGYLYSGLRSKLRYLPAMLITSLMFGLAHVQFGSGSAVLWAAGIDTFILSLVLVYLRETTSALYAGMLVHAFNNLIAFGVHFH
jgi:membrane protease YdiL (CAAX protease family)